MSKSVSANLLTDIRKNVTSLATCIVITRRDGKPYRLTSYDEDITFEGHVYRSDVPFTIAAVDSGSQLAIDNTELGLFLDGTVFTLDQFADGLFDHAEVEVFQLDYENLSHGRMTMRKGWFGKAERGQNKMVRVTLTGLLKILDFETGRYYQPTCDADFGDSRCKIAIDQKQILSARNSYGIGDWAIKYDTAAMTAITLTNAGFETSNVVAGGNIPGWTEGDGHGFKVSTSGDVSPPEGSRCLYGDADATDDASGFESYIYQDVDLVAGGVAAVDIDDGKISLGYFALVAQTFYTLDPIRLRIELLDSTGEHVAAFDTRYMYLPTENSWYERALVLPVYPNARTARLFIYSKKEDGGVTNVAVDNVRLYWWDHTTGTPYGDAIHRAVRLLNFDRKQTWSPANGSFQAQAAVANANNPTITSWTTSGWWQTTSTLGALSSDHGSLFLAGGDDGTGVQRTNTVTQTFTLAAVPGIDTARVLLGKIVGRFSVDIAFDNTSTATAKIEFLNNVGATLDTFYALNDSNYATGVWAANTADFGVPALTVSVRITLESKSPVGSGNAAVGFDDVKFWFYDAERPVKGDPLSSQPSANTVLDTTAGSFTIDNKIVWKAMPSYLNYDEVASVVDRKTFIGTNIAGADGTYETGVIWWISGSNAGLKNVVRVWTSGTKRIKMYFRQPYDIQPGDRFIYIRSCQKRFLEDCSLVFQNQVNFRGFPHLPGKLTLATEAENATG
jgi:hypothetical protein